MKIAKQLTSISALILALGLAFASQPANTATLTIGPGVAVKMGAGASLDVRDRIQVGQGVVFTSVKDDATLGQTGAAPASAAKADWAGIVVEASAAAAGVKLNGITIRFAGATGAAGLTLRKTSPNLSYLTVMDSATGIYVTEGASPQLVGLSLFDNDIGLRIGGGANPTISNSQIYDNVTLGISNLTPATVITATGNWWGDASGPQDAAANPAGKGNGVSAGVNYTPWGTVIPLINPQIAVAGNPVYVDSPNITLDLSCLNAIEYRVAENGNFSGIPFSPMVASAPFALSSGDGLKQVSAQYRAATGNVASAALSPGILYDTRGPTLSVTNPAAGSFVSAPIGIAVQASDPAGVAKVEFYIDDVLVNTATSAPYGYAWDVTGAADGAHTIRVIAYDTVGHSSTQSVAVTKGTAPPDTTGPALTGLALGAQPLVGGATIAHSGSIAVAASDPSGVARVDFAVDGTVFSSDTNGVDGYSAWLDLAAVPDGAHTLAVTGYDSLNNAATLSIPVTVALAVPSVPTLSKPASGLVTNQTQIGVAGSADKASQIQFYVNGIAVGSLVGVDSNGNFAATLTLSDGASQITATAANRSGASVPCGAVLVTVDTTVPSAPGGLTALSQPAGVVQLTWLKGNDGSVKGYDVYRSPVAFNTIAEATKANTNLITATSFNDLPPADGTYFYRVVAENALGTTGDPSNQVTAASDATAPKASSIQYTSTGHVDSATGHFGQGHVSVTVDVSEALLTTPFLSIAPQNGTPISVSLTKVSSTQYTGSFDITSATPSGLAYAVFSARDRVGNRGTEIASGGSLYIEAQGPALTTLTLNPAEPIKNDAANPVTVTVGFVLSKPMQENVLPTLSYQLSGPGRLPVAITDISQTGPTNYQGSFTLPGDAGLAQVETLKFAYSGVDALSNTSDQILAPNLYQVYQGTLPPAAVPQNVAAKPTPGGKVHLTWSGVDDAAAYQIYRQAPGETALSAYQRASGTDFIDATTADGTYVYAVASVRSHNGQESLSLQSNSVTAVADSVPPDAPQNLALALTGAGIQATWGAPAATDVASYNLYRSSSATITDISGLTPIRTGIKQLGAIDPAPSLSDHSYVVTALDAAGNESPISNSAYLDFALLPVSTLTVLQSGTDMPVVSWTNTSQTATGYDIYVGPDNAAFKLNSTLLTATRYTDTGYTGDERRYSVVAVDSSGAQMARTIVLPKATARLTGGTPLQRGIMNRLQYQVTNGGATEMNNVTVKAAAGTHSNTSVPFSLSPGQTTTVSVIMGGYADLASPLNLVTTLEVAPQDGEKVDIVRSADVDVRDGALTLGIITQSMTRGGQGQVQFTIDNTSAVDMQVVTATQNGRAASNEMRVKLLDADGNVLAMQPVKQFVGNVTTLPNGKTVATIPAGSTFTSDPIAITVPGSAPDTVTVELDIDQLHYDLGQPDQVDIPGMSGRAPASLIDTAYYGQVTSVAPQSSFGEQPIVIAGQALDRTSGQPLGHVPLKVVLTVAGFERDFNVFTDAGGSFSYTFTPGPTDAGLFHVSVVHPDILDRPNQSQFVINRVSVTPGRINLTEPRNYAQPVTVTAAAGVGSGATNLHFVYDAADQPTGVLPQGVTVTPGSPVTVGSKQKASLSFTLSADNTAADTGVIVLNVLCDERGTTPVGSVRINYRLVDAQPMLFPSPSYVNTGVVQGGQVTEQVTLRNKGLAPAANVAVVLQQADGTPAPSWIALSTPGNLGNLAEGDQATIEITAQPDTTVTPAIYTFKLHVTGDNLSAGDVNVYVSVTQSGIGNVLFKLSDIYTGTMGKDGQLVPGLANASIEVQNEQVASVDHTLITDSQGEALFTGLPAGFYQYRASATNHQQLTGRFDIKPGVTASQAVFLDYNLVTVNWSVKETTIQDQYDIVLKATYETNVPAAVVVLEPTSVNLPALRAGDVFNGQLTLTNYGLIRADKLQIVAPKSDAYLQFQFLTQLPASIEAKQRITIPYKIVALQSLDPSGAASGGGCFSYSNGMSVKYSYQCANGAQTNGSASTGWFYTSGNSCGGTTAIGTLPLGIGGGGGAGGWGGGAGGPSYTSLSGAQCIPFCFHCMIGNLWR